MHFVSMGRGFFVKDKEQRPHKIGDLSKWLLKFIFQTEHFVNVAALLFMGSYCYLQIRLCMKFQKIDPAFATLVSTIAGFYFRGKIENAKHKIIHTKQKGG